MRDSVGSLGGWIVWHQRCESSTARRGARSPTADRVGEGRATPTRGGRAGDGAESGGTRARWDPAGCRAAAGGRPIRRGRRRTRERGVAGRPLAKVQGRGHPIAEGRAQAHRQPHRPQTKVDTACRSTLHCINSKRTKTTHRSKRRSPEKLAAEEFRAGAKRRPARVVTLCGIPRRRPLRRHPGPPRPFPPGIRPPYARSSTMRAPPTPRGARRRRHHPPHPRNGITLGCNPYRCTAASRNGATSARDPLSGTKGRER